MPLKLIANIAYERDNVPDEWRWKQIGRLYYDKDLHQCKIAIYAFHQGLCIAKPGDFEFYNLQGEILYPVEVIGEEVRYAFVGLLTTSENAKRETIHSIRFEAFPLARPLYGNQLWLKVNLDDSENYETKDECPFGEEDDPCPF